MNRSMAIFVAIGALVATPALAQQPIQPQQPAPAYPPPNGEQYGHEGAQPQMETPSVQPVDPYASDDEEDDEGYDVTYDVTTQPEQQYDDGYDPNAYQQFESQLAPYGSWQDVPSYGHVWIPSTTAVGYDFAPYSS